MKSEINLSEFEKTSYLKTGNLNGRVVPLFPFFHGDENWEFWINMPDGLQKFQAKPCESHYYSKEKARESDFFSPFLSFFFKRASWADVVNWLFAISDDLQNLGAAFSKLELFHKLWKNEKIEVRRFVVSELELVIGILKSMFDLQQEIIFNIWAKVKFFDTGIKRQNLPKTFRKMILIDDKISSSTAIAAKWHLPNEVAEYYQKQGEIFCFLRDLRDKIIHGGQSLDFVFVSEEGFSISFDKAPAKELKIWTTQNSLENNLGSIKSFLSYIVLMTLNSFNEFQEAISGLIQFPEDISPGNLVFIRGYHIDNLNKLEENVYTTPWYKDQQYA